MDADTRWRRIGAGWHRIACAVAAAALGVAVGMACGIDAPEAPIPGILVSEGPVVVDPLHREYEVRLVARNGWVFIDGATLEATDGVTVGPDPTGETLQAGEFVRASVRLGALPHTSVSGAWEVRYRNATGTSVLVVPFLQSAVSQRADVVPASLDFGRIPPGRPWQMSVSVGNTGGKPLTIEDAFIAGGGGYFRVDTGTVPSLPMDLAPGARVEIPVAYQAEDSAPRAARLVVRTDDPNEADEGWSVRVEVNSRDGAEHGGR